MIAVASGFSTAHAVLTPSAQPHVPTLSGATVSLCPRVCLRIQVQPRVLDALKTALALKDQLVQHSHTGIQVRVPDPVGVLGVELVILRHAAGVLTSLTPTATSEARPSTSRSR